MITQRPTTLKVFKFHRIHHFSVELNIYACFRNKFTSVLCFFSRQNLTIEIFCTFHCFDWIWDDFLLQTVFPIVFVLFFLNYVLVGILPEFIFIIHAKNTSPPLSSSISIYGIMQIQNNIDLSLSNILGTN